MTESLYIHKQDITDCKIVERPAPALSDGQVLMRIDHFALTANNITYASFGEQMGYWHFFPAGDAAFGQLPVWGAATVAQSKCEEVAEGERVYGYYPAASHVVLQPGKVRDAQFVDAAPHRQKLPAAYNSYMRLEADPMHDPATEAERALFAPLFITSWLIDDWLADSEDFGAQQIVLSSASSKTSIGLAWCFSRRTDAPVIVGLTSDANRAFVESLGVYTQVIGYGEIGDQLSPDASVFVDMAGNASVRYAVHDRLGDKLKYSCAVGGAHWDQQAHVKPVEGSLPGVKPEFFFAPAHMKKRADDWGMAEVHQRFGSAWVRFVGWVPAWHRVEQSTGRDAVQARYDALIQGVVDPAVGTVLSFRA